MKGSSGSPNSRPSEPKPGFPDGTASWLKADDILAFEVPTTN